ncbi:MAG: hypothetical protein COA78_21655, partial [Blastopirellula sp.]
NPETFPLELITRIDFSGKVKINVVRPRKNEQPFRWHSESFELPREFGVETLIEKTEALSRKEFVDALKLAGYTGKPSEWNEETEVSEETYQKLKELNFISQYTLIQEMHQVIKEEGESPERIAVLSLAYSNLGSLTENLWSPVHKVFKARGLLYAERLTARTEDSPWSLAHRAYARALAGRHHSALADIELIRAANDEDSNNKRPVPEWLDLIDAYCAYKPKVLEKSIENEETQQLALYLQILLTDPISEESKLLTITDQFLQLEPASCRAMDRLCETYSLGILRNVTGNRLDQIWLAVYEKMIESDLPNSVTSVIKWHLSPENNWRSEEETRIKLISDLKSSKETGLEPSLSVLGQLLQDVSFLHTYRKIKVHTGTFGYPADDFIPQFRPLIKGHPYEQFIEGFTTNQTEWKPIYEKLLQSYKPIELEINTVPLIDASSYKLNQQAYGSLYNEVRKNIDLVYQDQLLYARWFNLLNIVDKKMYQEENARNLLKVSPHMPQAVAMKINIDSEYVEEHATELMEKYSENVVVLTALSKKYIAVQQDDKAEVILKRLIDISPDYTSYTALADLYSNRGEPEMWKETIEKSLDLPSLGLSNARVQSELAWYHMKREEWDLAKPFAENAGATYAAWGLQCAAECYEGLGDLQQAEVFIRACSMRYSSTAADWYFWCVRTGYGDIDSARRLVEQQLLANPNSLYQSHRRTKGVYQYVQGLKSQALDTLISAFQKSQYPYTGMHAALIADELGLSSQRDDLLKQVASLKKKDRELAELSNMFQRILQSKDPAEWNPTEFQSQLATSSEGDATNMYYFTGRFLEHRDQKIWADIYLQLAASSPKTKLFNCTLAVHHLRSQNREIRQRRDTEQAEGYDKVKLLLVKAAYNDRVGKWENAIKLYDEILDLKPQLSVALLLRGTTYDSMGQYPEALADFKRAAELEPEGWIGHFNLAFLLASCKDDDIRNGTLALEHAQKAFDLLPTKYGTSYTILAVAYAELGDFEKAIDLQKQARTLGSEEDYVKLSKKILLFEKGEPFRSSSSKEKEADK